MTTQTKTGISWDDLIPFTGRSIETQPEWTHQPWMSDGMAWATDGRIILCAQIDEIPDQVITNLTRDPDAERQQIKAERLMRNTVEAFDGRFLLDPPPGGIPITVAAPSLCPACGHEVPAGRPEPVAVAVNHGIAFFDAYYLNLLHALPVELDFVIDHPKRAARFFDQAGKLSGLLMPMVLSPERAAEVTNEQYGPQP